MAPDEHDAGSIPVEEHAHGVSLGFADGAWDIVFPSGWHAMTTDEDDLWEWGAGELVGRVRLRRSPRIQLEVDVTNGRFEVAEVESPRVVLSPAGTQVPWIAGSAGEVLLTSGDATQSQTVLWVQHRGSCQPLAKGFELFQSPLLLRPGQRSSAVWRRNLLPSASLVPEPAWVPRQRYLPLGDVLEVEHVDAALAGDGLQIATTVDGSEVAGDVGLHHLAFLDARGTALVEIGWFASLTQIAGTGATLAGADPNLAAWLLASTADTAVDLDALDIALAGALEEPTAWGVLAGMLAATRTELPVSRDVARAAGLVWQSESDPVLRRLLITRGLLSGWEPDLVAHWLTTNSGGPDPVVDMSAQEMLASVGFGRITSSPAVCPGRSVATAGLWLGARGESSMAAEWEHAVDTSRRRLMCDLSRSPDVLNIAWLLADSQMTQD